MNNSIDDHIERRLSKILQSKNYINSYSNQLFKQKNNFKIAKNFIQDIENHLKIFCYTGMKNFNLYK